VDPDPTIRLAGLRLAVVTPMANERETAARFIAEVQRVTASFAEVRHFIVLDGMSTDGTRDLVEAMAREDDRVVSVWAPENRSVVDAYRRGYEAALAGRFDWVLEIDAGFSHQPSEFTRFVPHLLAGADCVFGSRYAVPGSVAEAPLARRLVSRGGTRLANLLLGTRLSDMTSGYQLFSAAALRRILDAGIRSRGHFFQTEMKFHARAMAVAEVPITYRAPSPSLNARVLGDAMVNLARLSWVRIRG